MKLEFLYSNFYLFGDNAHLSYIKKCLPEAEIILTEIDDVPAFTHEKVDLIYMGGMSETNRNRCLKKLKPLKGALENQIDNKVHMLFTSTAFDMLGEYINTASGKVEALNMFNFYTDEDLMKRYGGYTYGIDSMNEKICGMTSRFTQNFPTGNIPEFVQVKKGYGMNKKIMVEGINIKNFYATASIGPFLIWNPAFAKRFLSEIAGRSVELPFEELQFQCFNEREQEMLHPETMRSL